MIMNMVGLMSMGIIIIKMEIKLFPQPLVKNFGRRLDMNVIPININKDDYLFFDDENDDEDFDDDLIK